MLLKQSQAVGIVSYKGQSDFSLMSLPSTKGEVAKIGDAPVVTKRILFIDDELNVRQVVKACLETLGGWNVLLAASGQEGLLMAMSEQPDAILLDVMMPDMDGLACLRQLQSEPVTGSIPVVFLTARLSLTEPRRFQELGVKGAIAKPFNSLTLVPQIAKALDWNLDNQL